MACAVVLVAVARVEAGAAGLTLCVNPGGTGGCLATIHAAVDAATPGSTIDVAAGTYAENVASGTRKVLSIEGAAAGTTIVDGGGSGSAMAITGTGSRIAISGVTLRNAGSFGALRVGSRAKVGVTDCVLEGSGDGLVVDGARVALLRTIVRDNAYGIQLLGNGRLELDQVELADNDFDGLRGTDRSQVIARVSTVSGNGDNGIVGSRITVLDSTIRDNGQLGIRATALRLERSTVSGNGGAGVAVGFRSSRISASTISGNLGGGIVVQQPAGLTVKNSTISSNTGVLGAGIRVEDVLPFQRPSLKLRITGSTIASNTASVEGGGIFTPDGQPQSSMPVLEATILGDNQAPTGPDCTPSIVSKGWTVLESTSDCALAASGAGDVLGSDPALGPLQDNGGPTETHAPLPLSPALDIVTVARHCKTDQRGAPRAVPCDAGAVEAP